MSMIRQNLPFAGVTSRTLYLMGAMRADVIVDFSHYTAGDMLIVYNDAPTPMPMFNSSYDYYTDSPDKFPVGAYPTPAGFGPNIRTLMQIRIAGTKTSTLNFDVTATPGFRSLSYRVLQPADPERPIRGDVHRSEDGVAEGLCSSSGKTDSAAAGV